MSKSFLVIFGVAVSIASVAIIYPANRAAPAPERVEMPPNQQDPIGSPEFWAWSTLFDAAHRAGGLEMNSSGFHGSVGNPMHANGIWTLPIHHYSDDGMNAGTRYAVNLRRDAPINASITHVATAANANLGGFDVIVTFSDVVLQYAAKMQAPVDAFSAGQTTERPESEFVYLIHNNVGYGGFAYGALATAIIGSGGQVRVAEGLPFEIANGILATLH